MAYLDFTQIYPTLTAVMLVLTGLYTILVDRRGYLSNDLTREVKWSKWIGITWIAAGIALFITGWIWRNFIW